MLRVKHEGLLQLELAQDHLSQNLRDKGISIP